jgi:ankyrin repeat protein
LIFNKNYINQMQYNFEDVDPSADNNWAIRLASCNGHVEVVRLLLNDNRVNPSELDNYAIRWASHNGHVEVVVE